MRTTLWAIAVAFALSVPLCSQTQPEQNSDIIVRLPASVSRSNVSEEDGAERRRVREWGGEVWLESECDDNPLLSTDNPVSDCALVVRPHVSLKFGNARTTINAYSGGAHNRHSNLTSYNNSEQWLGFDLQHSFTRRLDLRVQQFFDHRGMAATGSFPSEGASLGLMQGLNPLIVAPAADRTTLDVAAQATYRTSERGVVGVAGTYSQLRYGSARDTSVELPTTGVGTTSLMYSRLVSRRHWPGLNYVFQHMRWGAEAWEGVHGLLYTHTIAFAPWITLGTFIGPEYSTRHGVENPIAPEEMPVRAKWVVAAGSSLTIATKRTDFEVSFVRRVSDGGGLTGSAVLNAANVGIRRRVTSRITLDLHATVGNTEPLYVGSAVKTAQTYASLEYRFGQHIFTQARYGFEWERFPLNIDRQDLKRNRVAIAVGYKFGGSIGR